MPAKGSRYASDLPSHMGELGHCPRTDFFQNFVGTNDMFWALFWHCESCEIPEVVFRDGIGSISSAAPLEITRDCSTEGIGSSFRSSKCTSVFFLSQRRNCC